MFPAARFYCLISSGDGLDDYRIQGLLTSISWGFPVGAIMTLEAGGDIPFQRRLIKGVAADGNAELGRYLLDRAATVDISVPRSMTGPLRVATAPPAAGS